MFLGTQSDGNHVSFDLEIWVFLEGHSHPPYLPLPNLTVGELEFDVIYKFIRPPGESSVLDFTFVHDVF